MVKLMRSTIFKLVVLSCVGFFVNSCCTIIPFIECKNNNFVRCYLSSDSDSNFGRPVKVAYFYFSDRNSFNEIPADMIFEQDSRVEGKLLLLDSVHTFSLPAGTSELVNSFIPSIPEGWSKPVYFGVIAAFSEPRAGFDRAAIMIQKRPLEVKISLRGHDLSMTTIK